MDSNPFINPSKPVKILYWVLGIIVVGNLAAQALEDGPDKLSDEQIFSIDSQQKCKDRTLERMRLPHSTRFHDLKASQVGDNMIVTGDIVSENSFGGDQQYHLFCKVSPNMTIVDFDLSQR